MNGRVIFLEHQHYHRNLLVCNSPVKPQACGIKSSLFSGAHKALRKGLGGRGGHYGFQARPAWVQILGFSEALPHPSPYPFSPLQEDGTHL